MKSSEQLQLDVLDELAYDPAVDSSRIEVTATEGGVVTLEGTVPTYMQARQAERAAQNVHGVKAVVSEIEVKPIPRVSADAGIAEAALRALGWSASVPKDKVKVTVADGWITLEGKLDWDYQRRAAYKAVRDLHGARGVSNQIELNPTAKPIEVREKIEAAFKRNAQIDAQNVRVEANGGLIVLRGIVGSFAEREAAQRAAFSAPGVTSVDNRIEVRSHAFV